MSLMSIDPKAATLIGWNPSEAAAIRKRRAAVRLERDIRDGGPPCDICDGVRCATCERPYRVDANGKRLSGDEEALVDVTEVDVVELVEEDVTASQAAGEAFERRPQKSTLAALLREVSAVVGFDVGACEKNEFTITYGETTFSVAVKIPRVKNG